MKQIKEKLLIGVIAFYEIISIAVTNFVIMNSGLSNAYDIFSVAIMLIALLFGVIAFIVLIKYYIFIKKRDNDKVTQVIILVLACIIATLTLLSWFVIIKYKLI